MSSRIPHPVHTHLGSLISRAKPVTARPSRSLGGRVKGSVRKPNRLRQLNPRRGGRGIDTRDIAGGNRVSFRNLVQSRDYTSDLQQLVFECIAELLEEMGGEFLLDESALAERIMIIKGEESSTRHGGPYDRGSADAYYRRPPSPHYFTNDYEVSVDPSGKLRKVFAGSRVSHSEMTPEEVAEYHKGYREASQSKIRKEY